ncbi:MAG: ATP-dependent helicase [Dehalococcoidales bacterium]|nr:ATP-dependent helicase [Dehalococcoidales bacterium]
MHSIEEIRKRISQKHQGDDKQLDVVFSERSRLLVEAPAGYGKTNTMVSKIAFMLATHQVPYPKRVLALTFSVNAAYKIKKDVNQQVPNLIVDDTSFDITNKITVSNYHGFCRSVLKKYGYLLQNNLVDIDRLYSIDDSNSQNLMETVKGVLLKEANDLSKFSDAVKKIDKNYLNKNFNQYNEIIIKKILPQNVITFNAILTLTIQLFKSYPGIITFYNNYYPVIVVDEFQDTNILSYALLSLLINEKSKIFLLGDSLQRIYGFIGAVPKLMDISEKKFGLNKIELDKNHRFATNRQMLLLDYNIRRNAENPFHPKITENSKIILEVSPKQEDEAANVVTHASGLAALNNNTKIAVLFKQRSPNTDLIVNEFEKTGIPYFYGLFTDEDKQYIQFHKKCFFEFMRLLSDNDRVTKSLCNSHIMNVKLFYEQNLTPIEKALVNLLGIFWDKLFTEYSFLSNEDKISLIKDTFEYNSLKQYIEFTNTQITLSTVHAAKGLEWDFVILPDMEQYSFPNWPGLCGGCNNKSKCELRLIPSMEKSFLEELSVFYVAVTRAKRQVFFSASTSRLDHHKIESPAHLSCFLRLPGIEY